MVKADVLVALDAARGKYISGQELAQQLGVSRTAIWKAVAALRADGIPVAAVTNRGYILSPCCRRAQCRRRHGAAGPRSGQSLAGRGRRPFARHECCSAGPR